MIATPKSRLSRFFWSGSSGRRSSGHREREKGEKERRKLPLPWRIASLAMIYLARPVSTPLRSAGERKFDVAAAKTRRALSHDGITCMMWVRGGSATLASPPCAHRRRRSARCARPPLSRRPRGAGGGRDERESPPQRHGTLVPPSILLPHQKCASLLLVPSPRTPPERGLSAEGRPPVHFQGHYVRCTAACHHSLRVSISAGRDYRVF